MQKRMIVIPFVNIGRCLVIRATAYTSRFCNPSIKNHKSKYEKDSFFLYFHINKLF